MSNNVFSHVPLSYCIDHALIEKEDYSGKQDERFLAFAIRIYRQLRMRSINSQKVAYLQMDDLLRVRIPSDCIEYTKVGMNVQGKLWNLGMNNNIVKPRDSDCGNTVRELFSGSLADPYGGYYYVDHYRNGIYVGGLYGLGGGFRESCYTVDYENNMLVFDTSVPRGEIIFEYRSDGISEQTLVPMKATEAVIAGILWLDRTGKPGEELAKRRFDEAEEALRSFVFRFRKTHYLDMLYSSRHQTAKR